MSIKNILRGIKWLIIIAVVAVSLFILFNLVQVVLKPITLEQLQPQEGSTVIYDCNQNVYARLGTGVEKSTRSESFSDTVKYSVISIEDHRFYHHHGVDVLRTGKAILDTVTNGKFGAGGSTITQQLVKNATGDREVSISRKVREWFYAIQLEIRYSKEEILTHYLNIVYMGKGLYGFTDAAEYYFSKDLEELTINESAYLAGIIKSPETYVKSSEKGNNRKNTVLSYMEKYGVISEKDYASLSQTNVSINTKSRNNIQDWYVDTVVTTLAEMVEQKYSLTSEEALKMVYQGGFTVYSTVDPKVQKAIEAEYKNISDIQSAIVIMDKTGKVRGLAGGTGKKSGDLLFNRAISAKRQPGSSIKPLAVYAPAFESGVIDNTVIVNDQYINYNGWTPGNYYDGFRGHITIQKALDISCNTVPIQLLNDMGASVGFETLQAMGFESLVKEDKNLALAIGAITYGVTPLEMASGYQTLANGGIWCQPTIFEKITYNGELLYSSSNRMTRRVFSEETAFIITDLLEGVVNNEEGTAKSMQMNQAVAAKTGTTDDMHDRWLCAYTTKYVVAAWFGHDTPSRVSMSSSTTQKHVRNILSNMEYGSKQFPVPKGVANVRICNNTNCLATESCENTREAYIDLSKVYESCNSCNYGYIGDAIDGIVDGIIDNNPVDDVIDGFFGGLFGGSDTTEQVTEEYPGYEEPRYEEYQEEGYTTYVEDPIPENVYQN